MDTLDVLMAIGYYSNAPTTSYRKGAGLEPCEAKKKYLALQGICLKVRQSHCWGSECNDQNHRHAQYNIS